MSEPHAFVIRARLDAAAFGRFLDAPAGDPQTWNDWRELGGEWTSFDWTDPGWVLNDAAKPLRGKTHRQSLAAYLVGSRYDLGGTFEWSSAGEFTIARAMFSENLLDFIAFLTVFRGIANFLAPGETASAVLRDVWWGAPEERAIDAVVVAEAGRSRFLHPQDAPYGALADDAQRYFEPLMKKVEDEDFVFSDDAERLLHWRPTQGAL